MTARFYTVTPLDSHPNQGEPHPTLSSWSKFYFTDGYVDITRGVYGTPKSGDDWWVWKRKDDDFYYQYAPETRSLIGVIRAFDSNNKYLEAPCDYMRANGNGVTSEQLSLAMRDSGKNFNRHHSGHVMQRAFVNLEGITKL